MKGQAPRSRLATPLLVWVLFLLPVLFIRWLLPSLFSVWAVSAAMTPHPLKVPELAGQSSNVYRISGHVRFGSTPGDPGVAGATIYAGAQYSATTDTNGLYTITDVLTGTYLL